MIRNDGPYRGASKPSRRELNIHLVTYRLGLWPWNRTRRVIVGVRREDQAPEFSIMMALSARHDCKLESVYITSSTPYTSPFVWPVKP